MCLPLKLRGAPEAEVIIVIVSHLLFISGLPLGVSNLHVKDFLESEGQGWEDGGDGCLMPPVSTGPTLLTALPCFLLP